jgi:hypothetical protein
VGLRRHRGLGRAARHEPAELHPQGRRDREPFHIQQAKQIRAYHPAWKEAGHAHTPRVSVSRSTFPLLDDRDRAYFGRAARRATRSASST